MSEITQKGRKALVAVAEWLEAGAPHTVLGNGLKVDAFNMENVVQVDDACGTSCCIAGAICQFEGLGLENRYSCGSLPWDGSQGGSELARTFIGLEDREARELFTPWNTFEGDSDSFNSAARGGAVIRHLLATGEVDWNRFHDDGTVNENPLERDDEDDDYCCCGCCD